jgi:hypothetical protein
VAAAPAAVLWRWLVPLACALVTLAVFWPVLDNQFVDWDDDINFVNNPEFRGLGWANLRFMLTTTLMGHWIPTTWITFGADYLLWGMNPRGYHLTNLLLHAGAAQPRRGPTAQVTRWLSSDPTGEPIRRAPCRSALPSAMLGRKEGGACPRSTRPS